MRRDLKKKRSGRPGGTVLRPEARKAFRKTRGGDQKSGGATQSPVGNISSISRAIERRAVATFPSIHLSFLSFERILIRRSAPIMNLFAACLESTPPSKASAQFMVTYPAKIDPA